MNKDLVLLLITAMLLVLIAAIVARADHQMWPLASERQLEEGTTKACIYHRVERCTGLSAPLPRFARVVSERCPHDPSRWCLPGTRISGWYDPAHRTILLASGSDWDGDEALRHEFVHSLRHWHYNDPSSHEGPEWACE